MIQTLKQFFSTLLMPPSTDVGEVERVLQLASAVLLVEMMRADNDCQPEERQAAVNALASGFALADDEVARLLELDDATARDASDLHRFTSTLARGFSLEQRVGMIEQLWQVAFADGHLSHHETQLMLKLGDLLYIPRGDFVGAKQRARAAAGLPSV